MDPRRVINVTSLSSIFLSEIKDFTTGLQKTIALLNKQVETPIISINNREREVELAEFIFNQLIKLNK